MSQPSPSVARLCSEDGVVLPGIATAHSHAFQRALRGRTQHRRANASFWSWRGLMYRFAEGVDPDSLFALSRYAYAELARHGVCAVGEFHYLHHGKGGQPYAERTALAEAVIAAAKEVGIRISLLRVLYQRGGQGNAPEGAQKRFCDEDLDDALGDVDALRTRYAGDPLVQIGLAPHSIRALPRRGIAEAYAYAERHDLPFHMHVSEQRRELEESVAEYGCRPIEMLRDLGVLGRRFVGVHATHLNDAEVAALGDCQVVLCRTTERDLGDGLARVSDLRDAGTRLSVGVDSHARSDPFEELAAVELDERLRTEQRQVAFDGSALLRIATEGGYEAIGMAGQHAEDQVHLDPTDPGLAGPPESAGPLLDDLVAFGASGRAVHRVVVAGKTIVDAGAVPNMQAYRRDYDQTMKALLTSG